MASAVGAVAASVRSLAPSMKPARGREVMGVDASHSTTSATVVSHRRRDAMPIMARISVAASGNKRVGSICKHERMAPQAGVSVTRVSSAGQAIRSGKYPTPSPRDTYPSDGERYQPLLYSRLRRESKNSGPMPGNRT